MKQTVEEAAKEARMTSAETLTTYGTHTSLMFLRNRIKFFRPDGTRGDSPGCGSVLIAFGRENAEILRNCSLQGKYVELNNDK